MSGEHERLIELLRGRFGGPGWAFFKQVANRVGGPTRYADAVSLGLYRSRGFELHGFEAKTSRSDLKKEIDSPPKGDAVGSYCDRWWLIVSSEDIMEGLSVPQAWGILVPHGDGTRIVREAEKLDPVPMDRPFVAALIARAKDYLTESDQARMDYDRGYKAGEKAAERDLATKLAALQKEKAEHQAAIKAFEAASGVQWWPWRAGEIGAKVRMVLHHDPVERARWLHGLFTQEAERLRVELESVGEKLES